MSGITKHPLFRVLCAYLIPCLILPQLAACSKAKPLHPTNITRDSDIEDRYGATVAVLNFDNNTEIGQAGDIMESQFTMALMRSGKFQVVDRQNLDALLDERGLAEEGLVDKDPTEIGRLLGVDAVIVGSVNDCKPYKYVPPQDVPVQQQTVVVEQQQNVTQTDSEPTKKEATEDEDGSTPWGWIIAGVAAVVAIITLYWLWGKKDVDPDAARIGAYVKMVDVESGKILWQGEETYSGGDPAVKVMVDKSEHRALKEELESVSKLLSEELVATM